MLLDCMVLLLYAELISLQEMYSIHEPILFIVLGTAGAATDCQSVQ